jgi:hypothetical protein
MIENSLLDPHNKHFIVYCHGSPLQNFFQLIVILLHDAEERFQTGLCLAGRSGDHDGFNEVESFFIKAGSSRQLFNSFEKMLPLIFNIFMPYSLQCGKE